MKARGKTFSIERIIAQNELVKTCMKNRDKAQRNAGFVFYFLEKDADALKSKI